MENENADEQLAVRHAEIEAGFMPELKGSTSEPSETDDSATREEFDALRAANDTTQRLLDERDQARIQAAAQSVVAQAVAAYEEGEDPQELAERLRDNFGPEVALAFAQRWHADEVGEVDEDFDDGDEWLSAEEWIQAEATRLEAERLSREVLAASEAAEAQAQEEQERQREIREAAEDFKRAHPDYSKHEDVIAMLLGRSGVGVESASEVPGVLGSALRGARELERAEYMGDVLADFDEHLHLEASFRGETDPEHFDKDAARLANMARSIRPEVMAPPPTREQLEAQVADDLFGRDRELSNGWNVGGVSDGYRRMALYAQKTGQNVNDPKVMQHARKQGWLR